MVYHNHPKAKIEELMKINRELADQVRDLTADNEWLRALNSGEELSCLKCPGYASLLSKLHVQDQNLRRLRLAVAEKP